MPSNRNEAPRGKPREIKPNRLKYARIDARIRETGNIGIYEHVRGGFFELKFDFDLEYRVYFVLNANIFLILLFGGYKKGKQKDIIKAKNIGRIS